MRDGEGRVITFACKFATHTHPFDTQFTQAANGAGRGDPFADPPPRGHR